MRTRQFLPALLLLPLLAAGSAFAADAPPPGKTDGKRDPRLMENDLRFRGHPDLEYRTYGVEAYRAKDYERALVLFRRAARFGDKPSQGMIAELYANGRGVAPDMALAYAWMDLAAERGYRDFVLHRERYWARMDEATRARAVEAGRPLYAEYGDEVAKPRFALQLRRESKEVVGSRTGFSNNVRITIPSIYGDQEFNASDLDGADFWDPDKYWTLQDRMWKNPRGQVRTSDLQDVTTVKPDAQKDAQQDAGGE